MDGLITGKGKICGMTTYIGVMDASFLMGSMGTGIGEKLARCLKKQHEGLPYSIYGIWRAECRREYFLLWMGR